MKKYLMILVIATCLFNSVIFAEDSGLRIGVYPNPPLVDYCDETGASGFFVDLMDYIAEKEQWAIEYKNHYLAESFEKIESQELDLLLAVAYTEERSEKYIYNEETFYTNWGQVYTNKNHEINAFTDLEGKVIGVEKGDIHYVGQQGIKNTLEAFNIHVHYIEYDGRVDMLKDLEEDKIEAAVVSRLFGEFYESDYAIDMTPIQFNPIKIKVVASSERGAFFLKKIDDHLRTLKEDKNSYYYQELNKLIGVEPTEMIPTAFRYGMIILCAALVGAALAISTCKRQIKDQDAHIRKQNKYLRLLIRDITSLNAISKMDDLFESLVRQLREFLSTEDVSIVSLIKYGDTYFVDEESFVEGDYKQYALKPVEQTPLGPHFKTLIQSVDESSLEVHFDEDKILVPYDSSHNSRGYLYIECKKCVEENELFQLYMANIMANLKAIVYNALRNKEQTQLFIALGELIEKRDNSVANHVKRVSEGCRIVAKAYGYSHEEVENIIIASSVHDIGKIYVPDDVLNYPGPLSPEQFDIIKSHATDDFKLFDNFGEQLSKMVHQVVRHHHENWDGSGYPEGLQGEMIPHAARIVSIVDVFEALTHARPYKDPWPFEEALSFIMDNSGVKFDPELVKVFVTHSEEIREMFKQFPDERS